MTYHNINEIPYIIDAACLKEILGISRGMTYAVMRSKGFPTFRVGKRMLVHRDKLIDWIGTHSGSCVISQTDAFQTNRNKTI